MDKKQLRREDFSYTANSRGYMLEYRGQSIGGIGVMPGASVYTGKKKLKQIRDYAESAEVEIQRIILGNPGHYGTLIDEINNR